MSSQHRLGAEEDTFEYEGLKIELVSHSQSPDWEHITSVMNQPAYPQRGEDIHSKQAGPAQTGRFATRGEIIIFAHRSIK